MSPSTLASTERRTTNTSRWLVTLCAEFSAATGWELKFFPERTHEPDGFDRRELDWCWHTEINDGDQRIGAFHLDVPGRSQPSLTFDSAYRLADLLAIQVNRVLASRRQVDVQASEIGSLVTQTEPEADEVHTRLAVLLRASVTLLKYRGAALFVLDPDGRSIRFRISYGLPDHEVPARRRVLESAPADLAALESGLNVVTRQDPNAVLCLPEQMTTGVVVAVENRFGPMGTLWLYDRREREPDANERELLSGFGRQMADVLEYVVLQHDSEDSQRLSREMRVIAATHGQSDVCSEFPGFEVALRLRSCCEVGGDVCELLPLDEFRTAIVLGDASGHGIPANSVMASARGALHALFEARNLSGLETDELIATVNRALMRITVAHQFISLILAVFDSRDRSLTYTNAGHPPALHIRGSKVRALDSQGMLLGIVEAATYTSLKIPLRSGDLIVMFSDGILEARDPSQQFFKQDGVLAAINGRTTEPVGDMRDTIWRNCELHAAGRNDDDRSLLVMRVQ
jgi:sigma-B regulation protein RsbU (phosphoserine phosphatase)